jgi:hypothetical protein
MTVHGQTLCYRPLHTACARVCKIQKEESSKIKKNGGWGGDGRTATHKGKDRRCVIRTMEKGQVRVICDPCKGHAVYARTDKHHANTTSTISVRQGTMKIDSKNRKLTLELVIKIGSLNIQCRCCYVHKRHEFRSHLDGEEGGSSSCRNSG